MSLLGLLARRGLATHVPPPRCAPAAAEPPQVQAARHASAAPATSRAGERSERTTDAEAAP